MNRTSLCIFHRILGWRIRVEGAEHIPRQPCIVAANHRSYLDPVVVWLAAAPRVAKGMVGVTNPNVATGITRVFGKWTIRWLGMLPVDRDAPGAAIRLAAQHIEQGETVGIFPEGTRNRGQADRLLPGKTGVARLALLTGVPIIPAGLNVPAGLSTGEAVRNFLFTRTEARVRFGEPLRYPKTPQEQWTSELLERIVAEVMQSISELTGQAYTPREPKAG